MVTLETRNLSIRLGEFHLQDIALKVEEGEYFILLGPTGAGKTVLVECIAGLHRPDSGSIWLKGQDITHLKPEERGISYVPQDYSLFPNMTVFENIAFGLRVRRHPRAKILRQVEELVALLNIEHLLLRHPLTLSGGEKQRVALARALAVQPKVLLLDEPLAAVDERTRERLCLELKAIQRSSGATFVHVSHNFEETLAVADRISVMNEGRLLQTGTPEEIFYRPKTPFVAEFTRAENIFEAGVLPSHNGRGSIVMVGALELFAREKGEGRRNVAIRPEYVQVSLEAPVAQTDAESVNVLTGRVSSLLDRGAMVKVEVSVSESIPHPITRSPTQPFTHSPIFRVLIPRQQFEELQLREGVEVFLTIASEHIHIF